MMSAVFLVYALAHLTLFAWALRLFLRHRHPGTVPLLIVTFGLVYDNVMLAGGGILGHGELLQQLSVPRYFMHAFGTPLLMLSAFGLVRRAGAGWATSGLVAAIAGALTVAMIAVGVEADLLSLQLEPKEAAGVVSYGNAATEGPPVAPIITIIVLIAAGVVVWREHRVPWLFTGAALQFVAAAIGDSIVIAGNFGELALLAGLIATESQLSRPRHPS